MDSLYCKKIPNCCLCKDAILVEPKGFDDFSEVVGIYGLWEALAVAEVECPYMRIIDDLKKGGGLNG